LREVWVQDLINGSMAAVVGVGRGSAGWTFGGVLKELKFLVLQGAMKVRGKLHG